MGRRRLIVLGAMLVLMSGLFLGWGLRAPYDYILTLRVTKLAALIVVGAATGAATVLFQTVSQNRLLTPGIVGFDALFIFIQTMLVVAIGGGAFSTLPVMAKFLAETLILMAAAVTLFGVLLRRSSEDVLRVILTGVIIGAFLRGLSGLAARLVDPSEFAVIQAASFASFGFVDAQLLWVALAGLLPAMAVALWLSPRLDVAELGRMTARSVGLDHDRLVLGVLALVAFLIAVSTALVGPITFLGLLAASLAHAVMGTYRHALILPAAAGIGALILVSGQFLFERLLGMQSALAVIVEFFGGLLFLFLVLRRSRS